MSSNLTASTIFEHISKLAFNHLFNPSKATRTGNKVQVPKVGASVFKYGTEDVLQGATGAC